jgi:hypothetical protein
MAKHAHSLGHRPTHHASGWRNSKIVLAETGGRFQTTVQSFIGTMMMMMTRMIQITNIAKHTLMQEHSPLTINHNIPKLDSKINSSSTTGGFGGVQTPFHKGNPSL